MRPRRASNTSPRPTFKSSIEENTRVGALARVQGASVPRARSTHLLSTPQHCSALCRALPAASMRSQRRNRGVKDVDSDGSSRCVSARICAAIHCVVGCTSLLVHVRAGGGVLLEMCPQTVVTQGGPTVVCTFFPQNALRRCTVPLWTSRSATEPAAMAELEQRRRTRSIS